MAKGGGSAYKVEFREAASLVPYARNSRTHSDEQISKVMGSIAEWGWTNPVLADEDGIVAGHGRVLAALRIYENGGTIRTPGGEELPTGMVPVIDCTGWTDAQRRAYIVADNALAEQAGWDKDILKLELDDLASLDFDINLIGFDPDDLGRLIDGPVTKAGKTDPDEAPPAPKQPVSRTGDVWLCGDHRVMCGDSTKVDDVQTLMAGGLADMGFSDPPYGLDYSGGRTQVVETKTYGKLKNDDLSGAELGGLICNIFLFNKPEADVYICASPIPKLHRPFVDFVEQCEREVEATIVWDKQQPGLGYMAYRRQTEFIFFVKGRPYRKGDKSDLDLWAIGRDKGTEYRHGTQKPVALATRALDNSSKMGDTVLDLFGGSGSTLIACEMTGRVGRLMELDPPFVDVAVMRWQEFTGKPAKLESTGQTYAELLAERVPDAVIVPAKKTERKKKAA